METDSSKPPPDAPSLLDLERLRDQIQRSIDRARKELQRVEALILACRPTLGCLEIPKEAAAPAPREEVSQVGQSDPPA